VLVYVPVHVHVYVCVRALSVFASVSRFVCHTNVILIFFSDNFQGMDMNTDMGTDTNTNIDIDMDMDTDNLY
jgi:hypothetical protein